MQALQFEREAARRLPEILAELLDEPTARLAPAAAPWAGADLTVDAAERRWLFHVKTSSSPGTIASVADRLPAAAERVHAIPVLVVPYMTPGGARAAADRGLNWIDISGNASVRDEGLYVSVHGRPNAFNARGRPASAFAPKSSRVTRAMLLDPERWWIQKELAAHTELDRGQVSRVVRKLGDDRLLARDGTRLRPRNADLLLDAWADEYRFDRHDVVTGHLSGSGMELARDVAERLQTSAIGHAFTGLAAAWAMDRFARFRLVSVYVTGDPREAADAIGMRRNERGANLQLIGPDDEGVLDGERDADGLRCAAPVQVYLDLGHLPERAAEAAEQLRADDGLWRGAV